MTADGDLSARAASEVLAAHDFFVRWFRGDDPMPPEHERWEDVFAADFRMITPDGTLYGRDAVLSRIRGARGSAQADFGIDILAIETIAASDEAVLLIYVERQYRDGRMTDRRSTALFARDADAPRGVCWRHLQETWMQAV